jgi:hypothetical protein
MWQVICCGQGHSRERSAFVGFLVGTKVRRQFSMLVLFVALATGSSLGNAANNELSWVAKDVSASLTVPGQQGASNTRLEVGENGDARVTFDVLEGSNHTKGTIILIAGRWMLTQGFTPTPGEEIDEMDAAALTAQLVMKLLEAGLPKGPPAPGTSRHVSYSEKTSAIKVSTTSASGEYGPPWSVNGTVTVQAPGSPANYRLNFKYSDEGHTVNMNLEGNVADTKSVVSFPDSMPLSGWTIQNVGPYQERSPDGTKVDYGARAQIPKATTVGELRKLQ